jgi:hypothetical protein
LQVTNNESVNRTEELFAVSLHKLTYKYICQIMQGGISSGYKKFVEQKGLVDETYSADRIALVRISGTSVHNNKALQVDSVFLL